MFRFRCLARACRTGGLGASLGAAASLGPVIDFSDAAIFAMAVVNISALYVLMPIVKRELKSYTDRLKSGEIRKFVD